MITPSGKGAVYDFIVAELGGPFEEEESVVSVGTSATRLVLNDPESAALLFVNVGANTIYISLTDKVSASRGIVLDSGGGSLSMIVRDDLVLPAREWWGLADTAATDLYVLRLRRYAVAPP